MGVTLTSMEVIALPREYISLPQCCHGNLVPWKRKGKKYYMDFLFTSVEVIICFRGNLHLTQKSNRVGDRTCCKAQVRRNARKPAFFATALTTWRTTAPTTERQHGEAPPAVAARREDEHAHRDWKAWVEVEINASAPPPTAHNAIYNIIDRTV